MYTKIKLNVVLNNTNIFNPVYFVQNLTNLTVNTSLNMNFVILEREERIMLSTKKIDNLIEKNNFYTLVKYIDFNANNNNYTIIVNFDFDLNNMVKEIIWQFELNIDNYTIDIKKTIIESLSIIPTDLNIPQNIRELFEKDLILNTKFLIDGSRRDGIESLHSENMTSYNKITTILNPYKYNTRVMLDKKYNTYSFALEPTLFQPSGAINMSNINTFTIQIRLNKIKLLRYLQTFNILFDLNKLSMRINMTTFEYNIVRYQSGLAGILFIN
jgi:hypothetical protein